MMLRLFWLLAALVFSSSALGQTATTIPTLQNEFPVNGCASVSRPQPCVTEKNWLDIIATFAGRTPASLTDYGAKCDGASDDSAAMARAVAAAVPLYVPSNKTCLVNQSYTLTASIFGDGSGTLKWKTDLGAGNAGLVCTASCQVVYGVNLFSPAIFSPNVFASGCSLVLGSGASCNGSAIGMDGLKIGATAATAGQPIVQSLDIEGFRSGIIWNTSSGHESLFNSIVRNNYYGLYILQNAGDTVLVHDFLVGEAMAGIGCANNSNCLNGGASLGSTHIGFTPFGIYMEPGTNGPSAWIQDALFDQTRFESIGNAAIRGEAIGSGAMASWPALISVIIRHPGFSFNGSYQLTASASFSGTENSTTTISGNASSCQVGQRVTGTGVPNHDFVVAASSSSLTMTRAATVNATNTITCIWDQLYAIESPDVKGNVRIEQGTYPFTPGSTGSLVYTINGDVGSWQLIYEDANAGPPASSTALLVDDNSGTDLFTAVVKWPGVGATWTSCTISNGSNTCSVTKPWQYYAMTTQSFQVTGAAVFGTPALGVSLATSIVGANATVTATSTANCTAGGGCTVYISFPPS